MRLKVSNILSLNQNLKSKKEKNRGQKIDYMNFLIYKIHTSVYTHLRCIKNIGGFFIALNLSNHNITFQAH